MWLRTLLLSLLVALPARSLSAQGELRLDINIPENRLTVYEGEKILRTYGVAVGMPGHDTPVGSFKISRAEWNPWWRPPAREWARGEKNTPPGPNNPMGRVKLFFMPYYFIHGTPDAESIGSFASHGCVRMRNADVIALAKLLHTRGAPHVSAAQIDRYLANSGTTREVGFRDSIPLVVRYEPIVIRKDTVHVFPDIYKYNAIHSEAVYQALIGAGYDLARVQRADIQKVVERAKATRRPIAIPVREAFGPGLLAASGVAAGR